MQSLTPWFLTTGILACVACTQEQAPPPTELSDDEVEIAIESELWTDDAVDANDVDVVTREGVVTLRGTVDNLLARTRAEAIAEAIRGVRAVVNRIDVNSTYTGPDADLRAAVVDALRADPATDSYEVDLAVDDGRVVLTGTVDSWQEKQLCGTVAASVFGVREIENDIAVETARDRPDTEIEHEVAARLANDVRVDDHLIDVQVEDGVVRLGGTVGSLAEKRRAVLDGWVAGVASVDGSDLEVAWWARDEVRREYVARSDEELEKAVLDAFLYDPRVLSYEPRVEVDAGTVTLRGTVTDLRAKHAAEEDARNVVGVWRVRNFLKTRPATVPPDHELEKRVERALTRDAYVEGPDIRVAAHDGWVHLMGEVNTSFEKSRAGMVARGVRGVTRLTNSLDFAHAWTWRPDSWIEKDVEDQLTWDPYVDQEDIEVAVDDGVVTLTGTVSTWSEREAAARNAFQGGAKDVRNRLAVTHLHLGPVYPSWSWPQTLDPLVDVAHRAAEADSRQQ